MLNGLEHKLAGTLLVQHLETLVSIYGLSRDQSRYVWPAEALESRRCQYVETIHVETPQLELPPPNLAALLKGKEDPSTKSQGLSSPDKPRFESSIVTAEEEEELRGVEDMRYKLRLATISRAEHRGGHSDMREEFARI